MSDEPIAAPASRLPAAKADISHPTARERAAQLYRGRPWVDVVAALQQELNLNPQDRVSRLELRDARNWLGIVYRKQGWYEAALANFTSAIELDPQHATSYNYRGYAYEEMQLYEQALADYDRALALDPKYANARNNRGNTYYALQQYDKAIADYSYLITHRPQMSNPYYNRGRCYQRLGLMFKAIADYQAALHGQNGEGRRLAEAALRELGFPHHT